MDPFIGEIRLLSFTYAPQDWADCNGTSYPVAQNPQLYAVISNQFGGNQQQFNLPNLVGRTPIGTGAGPGLTSRSLGNTGGSTTTTLTANNLGPHQHTLKCEREATEAAAASGNAPGVLTVSGTPKNIYSAAPPPMVPMAAQSLALAGSDMPTAIDTMQPYLVLRFCIALQGVFPIKP